MKILKLYKIFNLLLCFSFVLNATEQHDNEKAPFFQNNQKFLKQNSPILTHRNTKKNQEQNDDFQERKLKLSIESRIEADKLQLQGSKINIVGSLVTGVIDTISSYFTISSSPKQNQPKFHQLDDLMTKAMSLPDEEIEYSLRMLAKEDVFQKDKWDIIYGEVHKNNNAAYLWAYMHEKNISNIHNGRISSYYAYKEAIRYYTNIYEDMKEKNNQAGADKADQGLARTAKLLNSSYDQLGRKYSRIQLNFFN